MGLLDDKRNIFNTIGSYVSFMEQKELPKLNDLYSSVNNKKELIPFLLDILKVVAGTDGIKELTGKIFTDLIGNVETKMKTAIKKQLIQVNAADVLPNNFKTDGLNIPVSTIDISGKFKVAPTADVGALLYNTQTDNFDKFAHQAIEASNTSVSFPDTNIDIKYDDVLDKFNFKPPTGINIDIGTFFSNYIDKAPILDKNEIITKVMDGIYGTIAKHIKRTKDQIYEEQKVNKVLEQILNDKENPFEISTSDYNEMLTQSEQLSKGLVYYDMGCGVITAELVVSGLTSLISNISGSTDPYTVSNNIEATITNSSSSNAEATKKNKETIRDGFFQKLINLFSLELSKAAVLSPQMRMILGLFSSFQNDGQLVLTTASEDMAKFKVMIKCIVKDIIKDIVEYIFNLAISYLIKLITPVIKKVIKEKINQYLKIILSLTPAKKIAETAGLV